MSKEDSPNLTVRTKHGTPASRWQSFNTETAHDRAQRYGDLFKELDVNKDGTICIDDLTAALSTRGLKNQSQVAQVRGDLIIIYYNDNNNN